MLFTFHLSPFTFHLSPFTLLPAPAPARRRWCAHSGTSAPRCTRVWSQRCPCGSPRRESAYRCRHAWRPESSPWRRRRASRARARWFRRSWRCAPGPCGRYRPRRWRWPWWCRPTDRPWEWRPRAHGCWCRVFRTSTDRCPVRHGGPWPTRGRWWPTPSWRRRGCPWGWCGPCRA